MEITLVTEDDLPQVLPLMRAYCHFYRVNPSDDDLLDMSRSLIADRSGMGVQLIARNDSDAAVGFATLVWTWSTLSASLIGIMNDLFVVPEARGLRVADELIAACCARCRARGATVLSWQTAKDNHRAQAVYERVGAEREEWLDYSVHI
ncbi:MAG: GNAT family N-acetyltransferase [Actinomycetota bacterium]|nr:GNAT family N-acetyltransferase [Actinomycetota bacterium]